MDTKWMVLLVACARAFFVTGSLKVSGVFVDEMTYTLNTSSSFVAWALSLQNGVALAIAPFSLALLVLFGFRTVFIVGGFVAGVGYVLCGLFTDSVWQLFVWFCLSGIGFGLCTLPPFIALEAYHKKDFPMMISVVHVFHFIGVAILPPVFQFLRNYYNLKESLILYGAIVWNLAGLGFGLPPYTKNAAVEREEPMHGQEDQSERRKTFEFRRWFSSYFSCFVHKSFTLVVIAEFTQKGIIFTSWALVVVSFGRSVGLTPGIATLLSTVGGIGGFLGKIIAVVLFKYDLMNTTTFFMIPCVINGISLMACVFETNIFIIFLLMFLIGTGIAINLSGLVGILPSVVCKRHFQVSAALLHATSGIGVQFGGLYAGFIYDVTGSTRYVLGMNGVLSLLMLLPVIFLGITNNPAKECSLDNNQKSDEERG